MLRAMLIAAAAVSGPALAHAAEPPLAAEWSVAVDSGMRVATTVSVNNQCHAPHRFALDLDPSAKRWLQFDAAAEVSLPPGALTGIPSTVDARLLDPGQYTGALTLRCLDCLAEPGCAARQVMARLTARWPPQALADTTSYASDSLLVLPA